ncbi:NAD(P)-dependent oxidoreductase [Fontivita pretiosa]|uniref:NAD(P)-dependent oxidoreductase n=1 Tax=Fontivita pretiosa TaxID=2989684 RepID=UPI003D16579B
MANVAFIGLGIMGGPMAGHLLSAGHQMRVHTRTRSKAAGLLERGARWADSPAEAADGADFVFVCVPDTPDVREVLTGPRGVIHKTRPGQIIIDHSTISPIATREMCEQLARCGAYLLDAPVSGGDVGARQATLSIMVGGEPHAFERAEPLLRCLGKTITYCGRSGNGQLTKLMNQILVGGTLLAVCEALVFASKNGLNTRTALEAVSGGAASSWQLQNLGPKILNGDFRPGFMIDLIQKDLRLIIESAEKSGTSLPGAALVHQLFTAAQAAGHGREGTQALYKVLENLASLH